MKLSLLFVGIFSAQAAESGLRVERLDSAVPIDETNSEHLDLEIEIDGERQLFPLLPGTR